MPSLNWLGKDKVVAHDLDVPYHSLKRVYILALFRVSIDL